MNVQIIKKDFPIFKKHPELVYLDSTATSLKPQSVIDKLEEYYTDYSANVHRGIYKIAEKATEEYEATRKIVAEFIHAKPEEVIFTRGTTEAINLVAYSLGRQIIDKRSEVVVTIMEHHSNFVPWQQLVTENGAEFKVIDVSDDGHLIIDKNGKISGLEDVITKNTKILALPYVSNVLGIKNPVKEIIRKAKQLNPHIITVIDAAQAAPHTKVDVQDLGCDFLAFSSHKMLGPTGVGILFGKYELLQEMYPFQYGGEMISEVYIEKTEFKEPPHKFEAGTPNIGDVIAFKEAIKYLEKIGMDKIEAHEKKIVAYAYDKLVETFGNEIKIMGPSAHERAGIVAFTFEKYHPHDVAYILDEANVAVRAGNHCAMPLHTRFGAGASTRASFYIYNDEHDVDQFIDALKKVKHTLS